MESPYQRALDELERAAEFSTSPSISSDERRAAEAIIASFRKSKDSIDLCKFILDKTESEYLRFDAAQVLRDNLIVGWSNLRQTDVPTVLAQQLINLMLNRNISYAVGRKIGSIIALIVKHQAVERNGQERKELVHHLISALKTTGHSFVVATTMLESLLAEHQFVAASMKTDHYLNFELHFAAKKNFENDELLTIFEACLEYFSSYNGGRENELDKIMRIVEVILFWCFTNVNLPQRIIAVLENDFYPVFKPPLSWERIVTNVAFENIFYDLHLKVRNNEEFGAKSIQYISQLFSMSGPNFPGRIARVGLLGRLLPRFINLLELPNKFGREVLGLSDVVRKVLLFHRMATLNTIDSTVLERFLCTSGKFTCSVLRDTVQEESKKNVDDRVLRESSTRLLEAWTNILAEPEDVPNCVLPITTAVFNTYLLGRLAPPVGYRPSISSDEVDDEDDLEPDDIRFKDQLQTLGLFGRSSVGQSIQLLTTILTQLLNQFQTLVSGGGGFSGDIYEDLHWILLISGHLLAYETEGETNLIPKEIVQYSSVTASDPSLSILCIEKSLKIEPPPEGSVDPVIRLISLIFSLNEFERRLFEAGHYQYLSPEVSKNVMWILSRIVAVYFVYSESQYAEMSPAFRDVWGKDSRVAGPILDSLLGRVYSHLAGRSEDSVQVEAVDLLASLTNSEEKARRALLSYQFRPLIGFINSVGPNQRDLSCNVYKKTVKSLMVVGNLSALEYWEQILTPLCLRLTNFFGIASAARHRDDARLELVFLLSGFIGIISSTNSRVAVDLFQRITPLRGNIASLISAYANYTDIVQLCLTCMNEISKRFLSYLTSENALEVYQEAVNATKAYSLNCFGRISTGKGEEDDKIQDLILLFDIMISVLTKDLLDLSSDSTDENGISGRVSGVSVSVSCLSILLPLLNKDMFEFPIVSDKYFRLISYQSELDSGAILSIDSSTLCSLMETVNIALKSSNPDNFNHCCEFITCLANHISRNNLQQSNHSGLVTPFLRVFFHMVLTMTISKDSLPSISNVIFALISAYRDIFEALANEIINASSKSEELRAAFQELTGGNINMLAGGDRQSRITFRIRLEHFVHIARVCLDS